VYQPRQIGLPGRTQLVRGASALLTGLVLPERPGYMGVNLSRQGSVCHTLCSFGSANSSRWDLRNSSTQGLGRSQTHDSIGFMPPSHRGMFGSSVQQNKCSTNVSSADSTVMPTVSPHTLGVLTNATAGQAETAAAHAAVCSSNWQPLSPTIRLSRTQTMDSTATTVSAWQHAVGSPRSGHASTTAAAAAAHQGPMLMIGPNGGGCAVCGSSECRWCCSAVCQTFTV
jgi:hypothetical protein